MVTNSGQIRRLLCDACNRGLGYFKDNPVALKAAADYIEEYQNEGSNVIRRGIK